MLDNEQLLDIQIFYLRYVHCYCYYCAYEFENERTLAAKCGNCHLRNRILIENTNTKLNNNVRFIYRNNYLNILFFKVKESIEWNKLLITQNEKNINQNITSDAVTLIEEKRLAFYNENTIDKENDIYQCKLCEKMFHGPNFVQNHIINKHMDIVIENVDKNVRINFY